MWKLHGKIMGDNVLDLDVDLNIIRDKDIFYTEPQLFFTSVRSSS